MTAEEWEKLLDTRSKKMLSIRLDIQNSFDIVKDTVQKLLFEGGFSFEALNSRLNKSSSDTLNARFKIKIQALFDTEQVGTHLFYKDALRSVEHYGINFADMLTLRYSNIRNGEICFLRAKNNPNIQGEKRSMRDIDT